ncbi:MAG: hypothetical protein ACP59X_03960 [Solidesulfovibrio sp. DCME]|uniref:hypothetical protein n=1 Tax=Solidesulfovibrio sp. DCME TaxID=3447380 RepID=UPI003D1125AB
MRRFGINGILTLYVTLALTLGIAALVAYVSVSTHDLTTEAEQKSLLQTANLSVQTLNIFIEGAQRAAAGLAAQPDVVAGLEGRPEPLAALATGEGLVRYRRDGEDKLMAVARAPGTGWVIVMSDFEADLLAGASRQRLVLLVIGLGVLATLAAVILFENRRLVFAPSRPSAPTRPTWPPATSPWPWPATTAANWPPWPTTSAAWSASSKTSSASPRAS